MGFRSMGALGISHGLNTKTGIFLWLSEGLSTAFHRINWVILGKVGLLGEAGPGSLCNVLLTASCLTHGVTNTGLHAEHACVISWQTPVVGYG